MYTYSIYYPELLKRQGIGDPVKFDSDICRHMETYTYTSTHYRLLSYNSRLLKEHSCQEMYRDVGELEELYALP